MTRPGLAAFGTLKQVGPSEERSDVDILLTEGINPGQASGAEWGTHQGELNLRCGGRTAQGPTGEGEAPIEAKPTLRTSLSHPPLRGGGERASQLWAGGKSYLRNQVSCQVDQLNGTRSS